MAARPCRSCALSPGVVVCRHCLVAVLRGRVNVATRWIAFAWAVSLAIGAAGLMVLFHANGAVSWMLAIAVIAGGALLGAVLSEQRRIHPVQTSEPPLSEDGNHVT